MKLTDQFYENVETATLLNTMLKSHHREENHANPTGSVEKGQELNPSFSTKIETER